MCRHALRRFECRPDSVRAGRTFVADILEQWGVGPEDPAAPGVDDILLVASELLTNALKACDGDITVELKGHRDRIELSVEDDCPAPAMVRQAGPSDLGGRGLRIVDALTVRWGQRRVTRGCKQVWCEMPVPSGSAGSP